MNHPKTFREAVEHVRFARVIEKIARSLVAGRSWAVTTVYLDFTGEVPFTKETRNTIESIQFEFTDDDGELQEDGKVRVKDYESIPQVISGKKKMMTTVKIELPKTGYDTVIQKIKEKMSRAPYNYKVEKSQW